MWKKSSSEAMPFSVARSDGRSLVDQVVDGIKRAIETGRYAVGDIIPSTRDMSEALGVSRIVTRAAVRELADAGYVNPRQGVGCVVLGQKGKLWKGTVLFIAPSDKGDYYTHSFSDEMSGVFVRNGWRFIRVAATRSDTSFLELELAHPVDLAIVMFANPPVEKILSKSGVPFVAVGDEKAAKLKGCIAAIPFVREATAAEVAAQATASGVKSAWQVGFEPQPDLIRAFAAAKIPLKEILVKPAKDARQPEATVFASQAYFEKLLAKGASALPDLLYFSDDYVCQGALLALARRGIEAPRDVKVVTWSNRGNGPYYFKPLARVELAPLEDGRRLAENLLSWLATRKPLAKVLIATMYFEGDTA
jgi:DNA-binding LacI/PurR family transcriptional regulator